MFPSAAALGPDSVSLELAQKLTAAIQAGENELAVKLVTELTSRRLKLDIAVPKEDNEIRSKDAEFSVKVYVEDRLSTGVSIDLNVKSCDTIGDLKRKMMLKYNFPVEVQRWIIRKRIPDDKEKLSQCGVKEAGYPLYLYLVTARSVGLTKEQYEIQRRAMTIREPVSANLNNSQAQISRELSADQISSWNPSSLTPVDSPVQYFPQLNMSPQVPFLSESSQALPPLTPLSINPGSTQSGSSGTSRVQEMLLSPTLSAAVSQPNFSSNKPPVQENNDWMNMMRPQSPGHSRSRSSRSASPASAPLSTTPPPLPEQEQVGWTCLRCTLINLPMRPGCAACTGPRPADYIVPGNYQVTPEEKDLMDNAERLERLTRQAPQDERGHGHRQSPSRLSGSGSFAGITTEQLQESLSVLMPQELSGDGKGSDINLDTSLMTRGVDLLGHIPRFPPGHHPPLRRVCYRPPSMATTANHEDSSLVPSGSRGQGGNFNQPDFDKIFTNETSSSDEENSHA